MHPTASRAPAPPSAPPARSVGVWLGPGLTAGEFRDLSTFIQRRCGIRFPPAKKAVLEGRVRKRLQARGLDSFAGYLPLVLGTQAEREEIVCLIDEITTNKTEFFRESAHFDYLVQHALPALGVGQGKPEQSLGVWSAGCSTGEEPFTLAMVLEEARLQGATFRYRINATDLSTEVLRTAKRAIYDERAIRDIPVPLRQRYLLRSKARSEGLVRIVPRLRAQVHFGQLNLLGDQPRDEPFEIIFCRNVLIYFDRPTQHAVLSRFCRALAPGGFLFLGHSDSITGLDLPLVHKVPSVYQRRPT